MRIDTLNTDDTVLSELGERIEKLRLARNLTQEQLAGDAGVGRHTVLRLEHGEAVKMPQFIRVLRALGLLDRLDAVVPESTPSPMQELRLRGRSRKRASGRQSRSPGRGEGTWKWGK
jgi:transcriptional regulator with XRE-family HTH domain